MSDFLNFINHFLVSVIISVLFEILSLLTVCLVLFSCKFGFTEGKDLS